MGINELFMNFDTWRKYKKIKKRYYNDPMVEMLYCDRWLMWLMPLIVITVGVFVTMAVIDALK